MKLRILALTKLLLAISVSGSAVAGYRDFLGQSLPELGVESKSTALAFTMDSTVSDGFTAYAAASALSELKPPSEYRTRGAKEIRLFAGVSPSVVLIVAAKDSKPKSITTGSGTVISGNGEILTNWHVVRGFREVGVIFKPKLDSLKFGAADVVMARVMKVDPVKDLALIQVQKLPAGAKAISFESSAKTRVGADAHAIGHPGGQWWTYTRGIISQIRKSYEWKSKGRTYKASVIQTQTPINPGNSGGPLLNDDGKIIGVNSFTLPKYQGLNFAVAADEIKRFLKAPNKKVAVKTGTPKRGKCKWRVLAEGQAKDKSGYMKNFDRNCDGKADSVLFYPADKTLGSRFEFDTNYDGKIDAVVIDNDRDGRWDVSYHDTNGDGKPDVVGYHPDGKLKASRYSRVKG